MATEVGIQVRNWSGHVTLMVVPLDDFDVIMGNDFFKAAKVALMPYLGGLLILDESTPCFVPSCNKLDEGNGMKRNAGALSVIRIQNNLRKGVMTYLVALVEIKPDLMVKVPDEVVDVLIEFRDVISSELPKSLPPRRA